MLQETLCDAICATFDQRSTMFLPSSIKQACFLADSAAISAAQRTLLQKLDSHGYQQCSTAVDQRFADDLHPHEFAQRYLATNTPVLLLGAARHWPAMRWWSTPEGDVDLDGLLQTCGASTTIPVSDAATGNCDTMLLTAYVSWWRGSQRSPQPLWYAKDWHVVRECAAGRESYSVPLCFADDWLNAHCDRHDKNDYRFVYLGPQVCEGPACRLVVVTIRTLQGTWTPLHADVLRSYSWSANVAGTKRWLLVPPWATPLLYDVDGRRMAGALPDPAVTHGDMAAAAAEAAAWPGPLALMRHGIAATVVQGPGDALFVPSGWHHVVYNETAVLSINHNWFNEYNVAYVVRHVQAELQAAAAAIDDCRLLCKDADEFWGLVRRNAGVLFLWG